MLACMGRRMPQYAAREDDASQESTNTIHSNEEARAMREDDIILRVVTFTATVPPMHFAAASRFIDRENLAS